MIKKLFEQMCELGIQSLYKVHIMAEFENSSRKVNNKFIEIINLKDAILIFRQKIWTPQ